MPCADLGVEDFTHTKSELVSALKNHSHDKENDACSPLCICNCCGCPSLACSAIYNYNFVVVRTLIDKTIPEYQSKIDCNYFGSIWQPPQINS